MLFRSPMKISVLAKDRFGQDVKYKVSGFTARAFMHEIDHLDGIVYTSKAIDMTDGE